MALKIGQRIDFVRDNLPPLKSPNTDLIAAWCGIGGRLLDDNNYEDTVEETGTGTVRQVTWAVNGDVKVAVDGVEIDFEEFRRRWLSESYHAENPRCLVTQLRRVRDKAVSMKTWIKGEKPWVKITKGKRFVTFHPDLDDARKAKLLKEL
jgi:hypothetical protein